MKFFDQVERRGLLMLLPLLLIVLMLAIVIEIAEKPQITPSSNTEIALRPFDPNLFEFEQLRQSGVPTAVAAGIVRWRSYGKIYRIKEDLAQVSGMNDSLYALLKPYIIIADSLAPKPYRANYDSHTAFDEKPVIEKSPSQWRVQNDFIPEKFCIDTASVSYLTQWGFSPKQAEVIVRYRDASGGIVSAEQFRRCYVVSEEMAEKIIPYIIFSMSRTTVWVDEKPTPESELPATAVTAKPLIDINSADSAELVTIDGIGPKSAAEIVKYRNLLGGYHSVAQIAELKSVTESNFEKILPKICCDSFVISKIDINFASPKELGRHPYVSAQALRRIIKQRQLKGGWTRIEELVEQNILSDDEAKRLAPYLRFGIRATE